MILIYPRVDIGFGMIHIIAIGTLIYEHSISGTTNA